MRYLYAKWRWIALERVASWLPWPGWQQHADPFDRGMMRWLKEQDAA